MRISEGYALNSPQDDPGPEREGSELPTEFLTDPREEDAEFCAIKRNSKNVIAQLERETLEQIAI